MSRGRRAAKSASVLCASLAILWEPLPPGGAPAFSQLPDTIPEEAPFLVKLRASTPILPDDEVRALWVTRDALTTPESIGRLVDFAAQTRFHLLLVQVRGRCDAYYRSRIDPVASQLTAPIEEFDPLEYLLVLAHRNNIAVHAWLNVFYAWSNPNQPPPSSHLVVRRPEWLLYDALGTRMDRLPVSRWQAIGVEGYFLSPGAASLREHMAAVVRELIGAYAVDGIHLDYIRFPDRGYGLDPVARAAFATGWGVDPVETVANRKEVRRLLGPHAVAVLDSVYTEWRTQQVDSMVIAIRAACLGRPLSAAVVADPLIARRDKGQDWPRWVHQGWVDFVVPMAYSYPPLEVQHRAHIYHNLVGREHVLIGLPVFGGREEFLAESVSMLREVGVAGYALFSYNALMQIPFATSLVEQAMLPPDSLGADGEQLDEAPDSDEDE